MTRRVMTVTFHRRGRGCSWTAVRPPRSVVPGPTMAAGGDLPHDLFTFVIEEGLGITHGFWGCVAAGARFRSLARKRTPQGRAVITRHLPELDAAERQVNEIYFRWRAGQPTPLDRSLNAMLDRWRGVPDGCDLVVEWPIERPAGNSQRRPSRGRRKGSAVTAGGIHRAVPVALRPLVAVHSLVHFALPGHALAEVPLVHVFRMNDAGLIQKLEAFLDFSLIRMVRGERPDWMDGPAR